MVTSADDPTGVLSRALDQTGMLVAGVRPEQATMPTPCRSWDVRALVNHVVDEVHQFARVTRGGQRQPGDADHLGDDWVGAYRRAANELLAAWREPGAIDRKHTLPIGEIPAIWMVGQQVTELVTHGWDIAKATGQSTDLDPELGQFALDWGRENMKPEYRGDESDGYYVGREVPVADDAPLYDRVAAFGGRDPR